MATATALDPSRTRSSLCCPDADPPAYLLFRSRENHLDPASVSTVSSIRGNWSL
jgi:hypothetical protein